MTLLDEKQVLNQVKTTNSDGNLAFRIVQTAPNPADAPGPADIELSNTSINEGLSAGSLVGTLSVNSGTPPLVITINQDLGNAFQIVGNELQTSRALDFAVEPSLNVGILVTDANNKTFTESFTISVLPLDGFANNFSYQMDGTSYIVFNTNQFNLSLSESINVWVKSKKSATTQFIYNNRNGSNNSGLSLSLLDNANANDFRINYTTSDNRTKDYRYDYPVNYNDNEWHMLTIARGNSNINFYIDGALIPIANAVTNQTITNRTADGSSFYLGANETGTNFFYNGKIDEISYHAIELDAVEVATIYNSGSATNLETSLGTANYRNWYRAEIDSLPVIEDVKNSINGAAVNVAKSGITPKAFNNIYSVNFDGITNYFNGNGKVDLTQGKTFSFWINRDGSGSNNNIYLTSSSDSSLSSISIWFDNNINNRLNVGVIGNGGGSIQVRSSLGISFDGSWGHIAITMPPNNLVASDVLIYLNANLITTTVVTDTLGALPTLSNNIAFGASTNGSNKFLGNIDEFAVFDIEANIFQVSELYNLGNPPDLNSISFASDIFQWWRFGDQNNQQAIMTDVINDNQAAMVNYNFNFYELDTP